MLYWAVVFLIVALVAALCGFTGIANVSLVTREVGRRPGFCFLFLDSRRGTR